MAAREPKSPATAEDLVQKTSKWEPAVGVRILRTKDGDKLQQKCWRRLPNGSFEHEWQDVPIETDEKATA